MRAFSLLFPFIGPCCDLHSVPKKHTRAATCHARGASTPFSSSTDSRSRRDQTLLALASRLLEFWSLFTSSTRAATVADRVASGLALWLDSTTMSLRCSCATRVASSPARAASHLLIFRAFPAFFIHTRGSSTPS